MRRREFITLIGGAAAWPLAARAQQATRPRRIAVLMGTVETAPDERGLRAVLDRLKGLGWTEGATARIDVRWSRSVKMRRRCWRSRPTSSSVTATRHWRNCSPLPPIRPSFSSWWPTRLEAALSRAGATGRQHYRVHSFRTADGWQVGSDTEGHRAWD